jgi:hypothetical protein
MSYASNKFQTMCNIQHNYCVEDQLLRQISIELCEHDFILFLMEISNSN